METTKFSITTEVEVTEEMVKDLLTCGFEGGVGYWCRIAGYRYPQRDVDVEFPHIDLPLIKGGGVICEDCSGEGDFEPIVLNLDRIQYGLQMLMSGKDKMGKDYVARHRANFLGENTDCETGDVFIQLCLFGEVVFG